MGMGEFSGLPMQWVKEYKKIILPYITNIPYHPNKMIAQPTIQPKKSPRKPSSQPKTKKPRLGVPMYIPTPPPSVDEGMLPSNPIVDEGMLPSKPIVDVHSDNIEVILHQLVEEQHKNASLRIDLPSELIVESFKSGGGCDDSETDMRSYSSSEFSSDNDDEEMLPSKPTDAQCEALVVNIPNEARKELSVSCDCGGVYNSKTKAKHFKTIKHMKFAAA